MKASFLAPKRPGGYTPGMKTLMTVLKLAGLLGAVAFASACQSQETKVQDEQLQIQTERNGQA